MARKGRQKKRNSDGLHGWRFGILIGLMDTRLRRYTPPIRQNISFYINHHEEVELSDGESWTQDTFIGSRNKDVCVWNKESNVCFVLCKASTAPLGYKILPLFCLCYKYTKTQKIEANTPCLLNTHRIKRQNQPKGYPKHASPSARICAMLEQKRKNDDEKIIRQAKQMSK